MGSGNYSGSKHFSWMISFGTAGELGEKSEWEANHLIVRRGESSREGSSISQGGGRRQVWGERRGDKRVRVSFSEIKSKNRCLWDVLRSGGGGRKIRGVRESGKTRGEE